MRRLFLAGLGLVLVSACAAKPAEVDSRPAPATSSPSAASQGRTVASFFSPPKPYPGPAWSKNGREVSGRELNSIAGPDHCEWQTAVMMHVGWPLGTQAEFSMQTHQFIRDPLGVIDKALGARLAIHVDLPADAGDTGYRLGELELWLSPSQPDAFLRVDNDVERWPYVKETIGCR